MLDAIPFVLRWRVARGAAFALMAGIGSALVPMASREPLSAAGAAFFCAIIIGSWWALLVAPAGLLTGRALASFGGWETTLLTGEGWLLLILGSFVGVAAAGVGHYLFRVPATE